MNRTFAETDLGEKIATRKVENAENPCCLQDHAKYRQQDRGEQARGMILGHLESDGSAGGSGGGGGGRMRRTAGRSRARGASRRRGRRRRTGGGGLGRGGIQRATCGVALAVLLALQIVRVVVHALAVVLLADKERDRVLIEGDIGSGAILASAGEVQGCLTSRGVSDTESIPTESTYRIAGVDIGRSSADRWARVGLCQTPGRYSSVSRLRLYM
jgi:hypothetical protein